MNKNYDIEKLKKSGIDNIEVFDVIGSTNTYASEQLLAEEPRQTPFAVIADMQSAGRGRYTKSFHSPSGSGIYMTYVYKHDYTEEELLRVTTEVAELILPVLQTHTEDELWIKPVNDIFKGHRKILGILVERVDNPRIRGDYSLVIGIGVNCFSAVFPEELRDIVGFLEPDCSREQLALELLEVLHEHFYKQFEQ